MYKNIGYPITYFMLVWYKYLDVCQAENKHVDSLADFL